VAVEEGEFCGGVVFVAPADIAFGAVLRVSAVGPGKFIFVIIEIPLCCQSDLTQVAQTGSLLRGTPGAVQGGNPQRGKDANNDNNHEQLDESEGAGSSAGEITGGVHE